MSENEPLLTVRDIARLLSISTGAVRKRASRDSIPGAVIVGGALYFHPDMIRVWIDPRESGARNRALQMSKITIRPWNNTDTDKEWEIDIRYMHPSEVDSNGKARRLRKRCQHVGTKASAEKWAQAFVSGAISRLASGAVVGNAANDGEQEAPGSRTPGRGKVPTLAEFHPRHLEYMQSNGLKQRTIDTHREVFRIYLGPILGHLRLDKIGTAEIEDLKNRLTAPRAETVREVTSPRGKKVKGVITGGKPLQASSVNTVLRRLSAMLGVAKYLGELKVLPTFRYVKQPKKEPGHYSYEQICAIVDAAYAHMDDASKLRNRCERTKLTALQDLTILLLLADTGIRVGELLAVHTEDVDLAGKVLHVKRTMSAGALTVPKGNRVRDVPLTTRLVSALRALLGETPGPRLLMRVHKWDQRLAPWNAQGVWESLNRTLTRAGMPPDPEMGRKGRGPHKLRHTCATQMLESEVDLPTVQKILGHARITQTEQYLHLSGANMQRGSARYEARMAQGRHKGDEIKIRRSSHLKAV